MEHEFTQEYFGQTVLHPVGLLAVIVLGIALMALPRRYAAIPILIMACFIAPAQRIALFSLNFDLLRLMVAIGTARIICLGEWKSFRWMPLDTIFTAWSVISTIAYIVLWSDIAAVKLKAGHLYDQFGMYFLFRCLVRDYADVWMIAKAFVAISIPVMAAFVIEQATARNLFAFLGGVPAITVVREGRLRCQGAFAHPILAGCFWAAQLPLIAALWWKGEKRAAIVGCSCSLVIIAMCASSTPLAGVLCALIGAGLFTLRHHMRPILWSVLLVLVGLHMVMDAPVWHLIARIDLAGGSTGWHRANLISEAVNHFDDWWLMGTRSLSGWNVYKGDITNHFILQGVRGGLLSMLLFIATIVAAFRIVGRLWHASVHDKPRLMLNWALGISVAIHVTNFIGVSYFGQITVVWYMLLAIIGSLSALLATAPLPRVQRVAPKPSRRRRMPALARFR